MKKGDLKKRKLNISKLKIQNLLGPTCRVKDIND